VVDYQTILVTIGVWSGVGAFADFLIGKAGRDRVRDRLEIWWLRFSYVRLRNFGCEEARLALAVLDRIFGQRFLSLRRLGSVSAIAFLFVALYTAIALVRGSFGTSYFRNWSYGAIALASSLLAVAASISITRFAARKVTEGLSDGVIRNVLAFLFLTLLQFGLIQLWVLNNILNHFTGLMADAATAIILHGGSGYNRPYTEYIMNRLYILLYPLILFGSDFRHMNISNISPNLFSLSEFRFSNELMLRVILSGGGAHNAQSIAEIAALATQYTVTLIRFLVSVLFLVSYILRPLHAAISTVWLRILESEKPIFTLCFGGVASIAKGLDAIVKYF
jgi:hypothetical protein